MFIIVRLLLTWPAFRVYNVVSRNSYCFFFVILRKTTALKSPPPSTVFSELHTTGFWNWVLCENNICSTKELDKTNPDFWRPSWIYADYESCPKLSSWQESWIYSWTLLDNESPKKFIKRTFLGSENVKSTIVMYWTTNEQPAKSE